MRPVLFLNGELLLSFLGTKTDPIGGVSWPARKTSFAGGETFFPQNGFREERKTSFAGGVRVVKRLRGEASKDACGLIASYPLLIGFSRSLRGGGG